METVDLHTHTIFSDGDLSPSELIEECQKKNIQYLAITDHDNISGYLRAKSYIKRAKIENLILVPGIEISSTLEGSNIHMLAYFFDPEDNHLNSMLKDLQFKRNKFARFALEELKKNRIVIEWGDLIKNAKGSIGRLHIAYALVDKKIVKNTNEAFELYLHEIKSNYAEDFELDSLEVIKMIEHAGGVCSIAHPHTVNNFEGLISKLADNGLLGIEVGKDRKIKNIDDIIQEFKLIKTAGSDFHRSGKNSYLGKNKLTKMEFLSFYLAAKEKLEGKISWNI